MRTLRIITIVLAALAIGAVITALSIDSKWAVKVSRQINAPPEKVFSYVNTLNKWPEWTVWNKTNHPNLQLTYEGESSGKGAIQIWHEGKTRGRLEILTSEPDRLVSYRLNMGNILFLMHGKIQLAPSSAGTLVTWKVHGDTGPNLIARLMMLALKPMVKKDLDDGLSNLQAIVEKTTRG
jgi:uncharacterized protein YndB with AHSA1/START domain